jgi:Flp pilus assembly protein TadD
MQALQHQQAGRLDQAVHLYRQALRRAPACPEAHHNLGVIYQDQGRLTEATAAYQEALRLKPDYGSAHYNLGVLWQAQEQLEAAAAAYQTALSLRADFVEAYQNLGMVRQMQGDRDAALAAYEAVLRYLPDEPEVQWNRALLWLAQGNLRQGWPAYEWRWRTSQAPRAFALPRWQGASLAGRTLLISAEQGVGDEILFASCIPDLLARAGHGVVECDPRLAPLFARSFPSATVVGTRRHADDWLRRVPPIDVYSPAGSLPGYVRPTLESFPTRPGYLVPDAQRRWHYAQRLAALGPGLKVGVSWRSLKSRQQCTYYPALAQWGALLSLPGVHFINLQYDDAMAELHAAQQQWQVPLHAWDDLDLLNDFDEVAALLSALDVVIGPENSMTALAGGLGRPVWCLTALGESWTSLGTAGSPWFPSMRVVRQQQRGQWADALGSVADQVAQYTGAGG